MESLVEFSLLSLGVYLLAGACFAVPFHRVWAVRMDSGVIGAGWFFRALITPGVVALWPLLAHRVWAQSPRPEPEQRLSAAGLRRLQFGAVLCLGIVVPPIFALALIVKEQSPRTPIIEALRPAAARLVGGTESPLPKLFPSLQIDGVLRESNGGRQLELFVGKDLQLPATALFWSSGDTNPDSTNGVVFLGSIWGPSEQLYDLPAGALEGSGSLIVYSLTRAAMIESVVWPPLGGG